jgi:hypothetical protein
VPTINTQPIVERHLETENKLKLNQNMLYIFSEPDRPDLVKIGKCSKGGKTRFRAGAFMNPRGLMVEAMWAMPDDSTAKVMENCAHQLYPKLKNADGKEWFCADRDLAVSELTAMVGRVPDHTANNLPFSLEDIFKNDNFDNLSEKGDRHNGRLVQRRIWIHQELGGDFSKISQNTWWCESGSVSTNAKRTTYNSRRMHPVECLVIAINENDPNWDELVTEANQETLSVWAAIVEEHGIQDRPCGKVGWSADGPRKLRQVVENMGLVRLALDPDRPPRGVKSVKHRGR